MSAEQKERLLSPIAVMERLVEAFEAEVVRTTGVPRITYQSEDVRLGLAEALFEGFAETVEAIEADGLVYYLPGDVDRHIALGMTMSEPEPVS